LALRASIIRHTAEAFDPDIFLVDKEPLGLRGEVRDTLMMLKSRGTPLVLGLRDIMDDPEQLSEEWERKHAVPALNDLYDRIWIYGLPQICDPLAGISLPQSTSSKIRYTGYLRRSSAQTLRTPGSTPIHSEEPYLLVTTGGGGDGAALVDWVLRAYEHDPAIPHRSVLVLGPFMRSSLQAEFMQRVDRLDRVEAITFDANIETLMVEAAGIVAMGGYNVFCEILSFDKPSVMVPRTTPRLEQYIRASRAQHLGLASMLVADRGRSSPRRMVAALRELPSRPKPSEVRIPGLLDGLSVISGTVDEWLSATPRTAAHLSLVKKST
jgi:predicted glycosyltransferase